MEFVRQYSHLGHIMSDDFDDASDINRGRVKLISQINSVLCYFRKVNCFVVCADASSHHELLKWVCFVRFCTPQFQ